MSDTPNPHPAPVEPSVPALPADAVVYPVDILFKGSAVERLTKASQYFARAIGSPDGRVHVSRCGDLNFCTADGNRRGRELLVPETSAERYTWYVATLQGRQFVPTAERANGWEDQPTRVKFGYLKPVTDSPGL